MKVIKLFLALTIVLLSSTSELTLPKCIKYESIKKVIENDWTFASKRIRKFIEQNSTKYVKNFMDIIEKPLVVKTDKEYIQDELERHQEALDANWTKSLRMPFPSLVQYKKRLYTEIKYNIYSFDRYKNTLDFSAYNMLFVYIRYLEFSKQYDEAFDIYYKMAKRFLDASIIKNKISINIMMSNYQLDEYLKALTISLKNSQYTMTQKHMLYNVLSKVLLEKDLFSEMLLSEKNELFKYLDMFYLDSNISTYTTLKNDIFFKGMLKIVEEKNLRNHLNNHQTMQEIVKNFKFDIEKIHQKLLQFKTKKEYEDYVDEKESISSVFDYLNLPRIFALYLTDNIGYKPLSHIFKYNFSSSEFVKFVRKPYLSYGKPWVLGKYKFEYEEKLEKNKKFLELLKKG